MYLSNRSLKSVLFPDYFLVMSSYHYSRYYGLSVWFPDVIKHLQADEYAAKVKIYNNERTEDFTFNFTLENQIHRNGLFINDR